VSGWAAGFSDRPPPLPDFPLLIFPFNGLLSEHAWHRFKSAKSNASAHYSYATWPMAGKRASKKFQSRKQLIAKLSEDFRHDLYFI